MENKNTARLYISKTKPALTVNRLNSYNTRTEPIKIIKRKAGVILRYLQNEMSIIGSKLPNILKYFNSAMHKTEQNI